MKTTSLLAVLLLCFSAASHSQAQGRDFGVTLDTSGLYNTFVGDYLLDFQLHGNHGSIATISDLQFGGGSLIGTPDLNGAVGIPSVSRIVLGATDVGNAFNEFTQVFTPGSSIQFHLHLDPAATDTGDPIPDSFTFGMVEISGDIQSSSLDSGLGGFEYATLDLPLGTTAFLPTDFATYSYTTVDNAGSPTTYIAQVTAQAPPTPEPGSMLLLLSAGLSGATLLKRRHRRP